MTRRHPGGLRACVLDNCEPCESCGVLGKAVTTRDEQVTSWHDLDDHRHDERGCLAMTWRLHNRMRCWSFGRDRGVQ